ncbi:FAD-dependent oxidoreductase domain-containing protein 2 [Seminavis robusta]|uniref:FAD-dependent oxidoreductase domain-containing protein 2 n=1 Tax=Seminavis robusta TaxID=568900 RepID=A0A9N8DCX3_9STRA|nr:FAD-dependent oxidoreductase domain-containing protein 2 [Seminavis robusta]|eukprot:Sro89_g046930.1 FAD-dependent oxidoreductase domain-containing protein 2 (635) ;mRNA; f:57804-59708
MPQILFPTPPRQTLFAIFALALGFTLSAASEYHDRTTLDGNIANDDLPNYLIVGAGGGGLQMALFLEQANLSYRILEKEDSAGYFWTRFPRFGELISVNKWTRNATQQWRFDWHSLLQAPISMRNITDEYFPQGRDWHQYMAEVVELAHFNVEYGVTVTSISSTRPCVTTLTGTTHCSRQRVFVGTGLREKPEPALRAMGGIPYSQMTKALAYHKRLCILGNGNSAFEVAQNTFGVADRISVIGKHAYRLSSVTRYTGDVRVKFLQSVENYYGKLLDSVVFVPEVVDMENKEFQSLLTTTAWLEQLQCERFVIATGFQSTVPGKHFDSRFPPTNEWYADVDNSNVHYLGWLMHERDFQRGAGGFLSGYRYLVRNLFHHVHEADHGVPYPHHEQLTVEQVVEKAIARIQTADDLIILQDGVVIRDVIVLPDGSEVSDNPLYEYHEGVTYHFHEEQFGHRRLVHLFFAWGDSRSADKVFDSHHHFSDSNGLVNGFLHPVVEVQTADGPLQRHVVEDLFMEWRRPGFGSAIEKVIRNALMGNLQEFKAPTKLKYERSALNSDSAIPFQRQDRNEPNMSVTLEHMSALKQAVETGYSPEALDKLRRITPRRLPHLISFAGEGESQAQCNPHDVKCDTT